MEKIDSVLEGLGLIASRAYSEHPVNYQRELYILCREYTNDTINLLKLMKEYRKALIANVLQHYAPDGKLYDYAQAAGEKAFKILGLENGQDIKALEEELYGS